MDLLPKNTSEGNRPDSFAFIIGGMKCGTTSMFDILGQHPEICPAKEKEPNYFIEISTESSQSDYLALWDWQKNTHTIALESSVAYTKVPLIKEVPEHIYRARLGKYRFIYMLRDPLDRIESQVRHGLFAGWGQSLDVGISEDLLDFSRYAMQLDQYLKYFSKDQVFLVTLEEFKLDPHTVLTRICNFLEIDNKFQFQNVEEPRNSGDFFNSSPAVARLSQGEIGQFVARRILPRPVKNWLREFLIKFGNRSDNESSLGRWKLSHEERILILTSLKNDLQRVEAEFSVDIRKFWNIPQGLLD